jgi:cobyrinic acid a,c-diamide synthase
MHRALQAACQVGTPILAEGGGLAYLTEGYLEEDSFYPFAHLIPGKVRVTQSLAAVGYRQAFLHKDTIMTKNLVASHLHWHFFSNPQALASFLQIAQYLQ